LYKIFDLTKPVSDDNSKKIKDSASFSFNSFVSLINILHKSDTSTKGFFKVLNEKKSKSINGTSAQQKAKVKFEIYGEEMIEKEVKLSGNSGRIYLPPDWVGHQVKIIRTD